ncbi:MAG: gliding motility-associated C-terminal domain-containing protein [Bacteroidota bacterium]
MKKIAFLLSLFFAIQSYSQEIVILSDDNGIYNLNLEDCSYNLITSLSDQFSDISFSPDGRFFAVNLVGELHEVDLMTGNTTLIQGGFGANANSLTISASGLAYITGSSGDLWVYDLNTSMSNFLGNIGREAEGDLTFYRGNLYAAVDNDDIIQINLSNPAASTIVINEEVDGQIFGVVSFAENCDEVQTYAITDGNSAIYRIDFDNAQLVQICELDITIFGGASTFEFFGSDPIMIAEINATEPSSCDMNDGTIEIDVNGGIGQIEYSLDGINYQTDNVLDQIGFGTFNVFIRDANECTIIRTITFSNLSLNLNGIVPAVCEAANGQVDFSINNGEEPIMYSIDGGPQQASGIFTGLTQGPHTISAIDNRNCSIDTTIIIPQSNCNVFIPNVFSPNGDNINDRFEIYAESNTMVQINNYQIFDRWGNILFSRKDFDITATDNFWDGNAGTNKMNAGVYVYLIETVGEDGAVQRFAGDFTLIR